LAMTRLSTGFQGAKVAISTAVYSGGRGWAATQALTPAAQAEGAELGVAGQGTGAEDLGEGAAGLAAGQVHLEHSLTGGDIPLCKKKVLVIFGKNMRYTVIVRPYLDGVIQSFYVDGTGIAGNGNTEKHLERHYARNYEQNHRYGNTLDPPGQPI